MPETRTPPCIRSETLSNLIRGRDVQVSNLTAPGPKSVPKYHPFSERTYLLFNAIKNICQYGLFPKNKDGFLFILSLSNGLNFYENRGIIKIDKMTKIIEVFHYRRGIL